MTRFALLSAIVALHFAAVLSINFMGGNGNGISAHLTSAKPTKADSLGLHGTRAHDLNATWWRQDDSSEATSIDPAIPIVTNYSKFDLESREIENIRDVLLKVAEKDYDEDVAYTKSLDDPAGGSKVINRYERVSHGNYTLDLDDNSLSNQEVNNIMDNKSIEITLKSPNNSLNQELETNSSINLTTRNENIERNLNNFTISENKLISNQELHNGNDTGLNLEENDDSKNILENLNLNVSSRISHQEFDLQMDFGPILNNINESIVSIETTQSTGSTQSTKFKQPIVSKKNSQSTETTESIQLTDSTGPEGSTPSIEYKEFSESIQPKESIKLEQSIKHTESEGLNTETSSINIVKIYNLTQNSETVEIDLQNNTFLPLNSSINLDIIHENNSENPSNFQEMDDVENNLEIFNDNKSLIISDELGPIMKDNITVSKYIDSSDINLKNNEDFLNLTRNYSNSENSPLEKDFVDENSNVNRTKFNITYSEIKLNFIETKSSNITQFTTINPIVKINRNNVKTTVIKDGFRIENKSTEASTIFLTNDKIIDIIGKNSTDFNESIIVNEYSENNTFVNDDINGNYDVKQLQGSKLLSGKYLSTDKNLYENTTENQEVMDDLNEISNRTEFNTLDNENIPNNFEKSHEISENFTENQELMDEELNNGTNLDYIINTNETFENDTGVDDGAQRIEINEELARNSGSSITAKNYVESRRIKINDSNSLSKNRSETNLLKVVGNLRATNDDSRSKNWKEKYVHSKETTIERPEISLERKNGNWKIFNNIPVRINNLNSDDSIEDEGIDHKSLEALNERSHELYFRDEILNDVEVAGMHYSESGVANNNGEGQLIKAASVFVPDYPRGNDDVDKKVVVVTGQYEGGAKVPQPFGESATTKRAMIKRSRPSMDQSSRGNENSGKEKTASTEAAPQTTDAAVKGSKERSSTSLGVKSSTVLFVGPQDDVRTTTAIQPTRDQLPTNSNYYLTTSKDATESTTSSDKLVATECPNCTWIAAASNTTVAAVSSTSMTSESISDEQTETIENTTSYANTSISDDERTNSSLKVPEFPWPVKREAVVEGDIVLGGLMMVHEREDSVTCGPIMPQGGIQALEAMLYTLDMLNEGSDQLLPNVTLGAHILDDCDKDTYGLEMAVDFIKG